MGALISGTTCMHSHFGTQHAAEYHSTQHTAQTEITLERWYLRPVTGTLRAFYPFGTFCGICRLHHIGRHGIGQRIHEVPPQLRQHGRSREAGSGRIFAA